MHKKIISKIKKSLYAIPFQDDIQHTRHKANGGKKQKDILIHNIPFLFTCDETEKLQCLQNHSIIISKGIIQEVIPAKKAVPSSYNLVYEAGMRGGIVVTPGLINAHAHPPMYLMRSAMMLDEGESIDETINAQMGTVNDGRRLYFFGDWGHHRTAKSRHHDDPQPFCGLLAH